MNDIKFRAWDKEDFKVRQVLGMSFEHGTISVKLNDEEYLQEDARRFELMQYTGLKDINGIEIYAEDIVREIPEKGYEHLVMNGNLGVVKLNSGSCTIINAKDGRTHFFFYTKQEVLGNIHEHPELLGDNQ